MIRAAVTVSRGAAEVLNYRTWNLTPASLTRLWETMLQFYSAVTVLLYFTAFHSFTLHAFSLLTGLEFIVFFKFNSNSSFSLLAHFIALYLN